MAIRHRACTSPARGEPWSAYLKPVQQSSYYTCQMQTETRRARCVVEGSFPSWSCMPNCCTHPRTHIHAQSDPPSRTSGLSNLAGSDKNAIPMRMHLIRFQIQMRCCWRRQGLDSRKLDCVFKEARMHLCVALGRPYTGNCRLSHKLP